MEKEIFISYSRRDQEFVMRLAADLDRQVAGVWFDQSTIQVGQKWHDEIMDGIRECRAFILVLSPDAAESRYVREELNKALELGKPIIPVLYRPSKWSGEFETLVKDVQTLDLRSGSYVENFQILVDGLVAAGAARIAGYEKPFMRQSVRVGLGTAFRKIPGWAFAWGIGWTVFWSIVLVFLLILLISQDNLGGDDFVPIVVILFSGGVGGFTGGLLAGLFTMLALRPNAPSISWKHMSPTIRVWGISGPLGMIVSGLVTAIMVAVGMVSVQSAELDCEKSQFWPVPGRCFRQRHRGGPGTGFSRTPCFPDCSLELSGSSQACLQAGRLCGTSAGWNPVSPAARDGAFLLGWGCGAIVATIVVLLSIGIISSALGL